MHDSFGVDLGYAYESSGFLKINAALFSHHNKQPVIYLVLCKIEVCKPCHSVIGGLKYRTLKLQLISYNS